MQFNPIRTMIESRKWVGISWLTHQLELVPFPICNHRHKSWFSMFSTPWFDGGINMDQLWGSSNQWNPWHLFYHFLTFYPWHISGTDDRNNFSKEVRKVGTMSLRCETQFQDFRCCFSNAGWDFVRSLRHENGTNPVSWDFCGRWPTEVVRTPYPGPLERSSTCLGWNTGQAGIDQAGRHMFWLVLWNMFYFSLYWE